MMGDCMESNFFEDRLENVSQLKKLRWARWWSLILIAIIVICEILLVDEEIFPVSYYVCFLAIFVLLEGLYRREKKTVDKYSGDNKMNTLKLYDNSENLQDVYDYINDMMANNQVLFRHRAFFKNGKAPLLQLKKCKNIETILLSKYMLDCTCWEVVAIPIDKVRVDVEKDYFNFENFNNDRIDYEKLKTNLRVKNPLRMFWCMSIYYDDKKAIGIVGGSKAKSEILAEEFKNCLPKKLPENVEDIVLINKLANHSNY